jgi:hypothetical protein
MLIPHLNGAIKLDIISTLHSSPSIVEVKNEWSHPLLCASSWRGD